MATDLRTPTDFRSAAEPGIASLVGGIITDAQDLIKQQFALFRRELQLELRQAKTAAISLSVGIIVAAIGGFLLLLMLVHLLDAAGLQLWAAYGVVGGGLLLAGGGVFLFGKKEAADVELAPPPQTAETMKENWQWLKGQTTSGPR